MDMAVILPILRVRVGLPADDTSKDTVLEAAFNGSLALAETYCDRYFDYKDGEVEEFTFQADRSVSLMRYPLKSITSVVTKDGATVDPNGYYPEKKTGLLYMTTGANDPQLTVTYSGGYETLPADLFQALLLGFDAVYADLTKTSTGGDAVPSGDVVAISVPDVGRVEFESFASASSGQTAAFSLLPSGATSILWLYRREYV